MTPSEYMQALAALHIPNHAQAARLLGVNDRTSRKWADGPPKGRKVPPSVARFLRYLIAARVTPEEVLRVLAK